MFIGQFLHTMDPKGRVSIPAEFRVEFQRHGEMPPILITIEDHLALYPNEEWRKLADKVLSSPLLSPEVTDLEDYLFPGAHACPIDKHSFFLTGAKAEIPQDSPVRGALQRAESAVARIEAIPNRDRTFKNTIGALDDMRAGLEMDTNMIMFMPYVSTDPDERDAGERAEQDVANWLIDLEKRQTLYDGIRAYAETSPRLTGEQQRLLEHTLRDFRRAGMSLGADERAELTEIQKELTRLSIDFEKTIRQDETTVPLSRAELVGVPDEYFENPNLQRSGDLYLVGLAYPQFLPIMDYCENEQTRHKVWVAYKRRGGTGNVRVLGLAPGLLAHPPVMFGARRDLGAVGHHQHLARLGQAGQALADRMGRGAADAVVDLVEHQGFPGLDLAHDHLEREQNARQLTARGDLGERTGRRLGGGRDFERHPVQAVRSPISIAQGLQARAEDRLVELERGQLALDRAVEPPGRGPSLGPLRLAGGQVGGAGRLKLPLELGQAVAAPVDLIEPGLELPKQLGQLVDFDVVLARQVLEREVALLHGLELVGLALQIGRQAVDLRERLLGFGGGALQGRDRRLEAPARARRHALQGALGLAQGCPRARLDAFARKARDRPVQGLGELFAVEQQGCPLGQGIDLAGLGIQGLELGRGMAQQLLVAP